MQDLGLAAALFLAAVFAWAGAVKAVSPAATTEAFRGLVLPWPGLAARVVPVVELATSVLLVVSPVWGAAASVGLLGAFTAFVAHALRQGRTVGCGCFGSTNRNETLTWAEPVRNLLLVLAALTATLAGDIRWPSLAAVITVGSAAAAGALVLGLVRLKLKVGAVWATPLPGSLPSR